ncbi:MAG: amidohydrolase family protein [Spirochaetota bacterium]
MRTSIVFGKYLIVNWETVLADGAVYVENGRIVDVGKYTDLKQRHTCDQEIGSPEHIVMPGFVNAHNHGKGITDFQRGHLDDTLETWKFRSYPGVDPALDSRWAAIKQLEAGVTTSMHNHDLVDPHNPEGEFSAVVEAYKSSGLKVAFAPTIANRNWFVYGDNETFVQSLPAELQGICRARMERSKIFGPAEYMAAVDSLAADYGRDVQVKIMHGPISPQWVDEATLKAIKADADKKNLRIHIHVQQTKLQNLYGYTQYGTSLLGYLDSIGFLDERVTIGHAVWISEKDIDLLAARGVSVTHHASCNLRVRNGISPVFELLKAGVQVGIGMDDKEFGDDKDYIEEMRLISKLHRLPSHRLDSAHLQPKEVFRMATEYGAKTLGWENEVGSLHKGKRADIVLLHAGRISEPFVSPTQSAIDLVLYRAGTRDVDMVMADGRLVVEQGKAIHVDRGALVAELRASLPCDYARELEQRNRELKALRPYIAEWFAGWYNEMEAFEGKPFYHMNDRGGTLK